MVPARHSSKSDGWEPVAIHAGWLNISNHLLKQHIKTTLNIMQLALFIKKTNTFCAKISRYLLPVLRIQIFVTLVALPILVYWGLPLSALTILGNIIFMPLLTFFLLISSLIFFFELLYLPNRWLIYILQQLTHWWLKISPPHPQAWLLCFPKLTWILFLGALLLAIYTISQQITQAKQVLFLSLILLFSLLIAKFNFWIRINQIELKHRRAKLQVTYQPNGTILINDHGILNQRHGIYNWLCYKLQPALIKNFGTCTVQDLYLCPSNQHTKTNLAILQQNLNIKTVHNK